MTWYFQIEKHDCLRCTSVYFVLNSKDLMDQVMEKIMKKYYDNKQPRIVT